MFGWLEEIFAEVNLLRSRGEIEVKTMGLLANEALENLDGEGT